MDCMDWMWIRQYSKQNSFETWVSISRACMHGCMPAANEGTSGEREDKRANTKTSEMSAQTRLYSPYTELLRCELLILAGSDVYFSRLFMLCDDILTASSLSKKGENIDSEHVHIPYVIDDACAIPIPRIHFWWSHATHTINHTSQRPKKDQVLDVQPRDVIRRRLCSIVLFCCSQGHLISSMPCCFSFFLCKKSITHRLRRALHLHKRREAHYAR